MIGAGCGGIFNFQSDTTMFDCTLNSNQAIARGGGGMCNNHMSDAIVSNCIFIGNSGEYGGGIANRESIVEVTNCVFLGNSGFFGGGLSSEINSDVTVTNCLFSGNFTVSSPESGNGGAMTNETGTLTVTNCTFSGNSAIGEGGGISIIGSAPTLNNCVFWGNSDSGPQDESAQIHTALLGSAVVTFTDIMGLTQPGPFCPDPGGDPPCGGNIDADPKFIDADGPDNQAGTQDDNLRLTAVFDPAPGSPCIDAADNNAPGLAGIITDLDGNDRFVEDLNSPNTGNGTPPLVDMGAYEFNCPAQSGSCPWDLFPEEPDNIVGAGDLAALLGAWGLNPTHPADFNCDTMVNAADLADLLGHWGSCP